MIAVSILTAIAALLLALDLCGLVKPNVERFKRTGFARGFGQAPVFSTLLLLANLAAATFILHQQGNQVIPQGSAVSGQTAAPNQGYVYVATNCGTQTNCFQVTPALWACDASIGNGGSVVTISGSDPPFTPANTAGAIAWMTNQPCVDFPTQGPTRASITSQTTITFSTATTATLGTTSSQACTSNCTLIWGLDNTTAWQNADTLSLSMCNGSGSNVNSPSGFFIVQSALFLSKGNCNVNAAVTGGRSLTGIGSNETTFVPSLNFNFASCTGVNAEGSTACFFSGITNNLDNVQVWGTGNESCGAGANGKVLVDIVAGSSLNRNFYGEQWCGNQTGSVGFVYESGAVVQYYVSDQFGAIGCEFHGISSLYTSQCTRNLTENMLLDTNSGVVTQNSVDGYFTNNTTGSCPGGSGAPASIIMSSGSQLTFYGMAWVANGNWKNTQDALCMLGNNIVIFYQNGGTSSNFQPVGTSTNPPVAAIEAASATTNAVTLLNTSMVGSGSCVAGPGFAGITIYDLGGNACSPTTGMGGLVGGPNPSADSASQVSTNITASTGWGTSGAAGNGISAVLGKTSLEQFTITAAGTPTANPTVAIVFPVQFWGSSGTQPVPVCSAQQVGGTGAINTLKVSTGPSLTGVTYTWNGTPVAGSTYNIVSYCHP